MKTPAIFLGALAIAASATLATQTNSVATNKVALTQSVVVSTVMLNWTAPPVCEVLATTTDLGQPRTNWIVTKIPANWITNQAITNNGQPGAHLYAIGILSETNLFLLPGTNWNWSTTN